MNVKINDNFFNEVKKLTLTIKDIDDFVPKDMEVTNEEFNKFLNEYAEDCEDILKKKIKIYFTKEVNGEGISNG